MIDHKQELWEDLDQLRDYALTLKRTATDLLDWIHVIETDMQLFIDDQTKPAIVDDHAEPVRVVVDGPIEPGSPCIDPDGESCRCYEGCTADCLPSEYKACKCPRKINNMLDDEMVPDLKPQSDPVEFEDGGPYYTLTEKGELIVKLINQGYKYLEACKIAATVYDKE